VVPLVLQFTLAGNGLGLEYSGGGVVVVVVCKVLQLQVVELQLWWVGGGVAGVVVAAMVGTSTLGRMVTVTFYLSWTSWTLTR
jgi:hypothetical protein